MRRSVEVLALTTAITLAACGNGGGAKLEQQTCDALKGVKSELDQPFDAQRLAGAGTELGSDIGPLSDPLTPPQEAATIAFAATMSASEQGTVQATEEARRAVEFAYGKYC